MLHTLYALDDVEGCTDGALGLVFMRDGISEEGDNAVTKALEHVAVIAHHASRTKILIAAHHIGQDLGIEFGGELGITDDIAEQNRELAALLFFRLRAP